MARGKGQGGVGLIRSMVRGRVLGVGRARAALTWTNPRVG